MYEVRPLRRALKRLEEIRDTNDEKTIEDMFSQLSLNPRPRDYWDCEDDAEAKYIYAGQDRKWMITYEIDDRDGVVYVHSIDPRPSMVFDPR